MTHEPARPLAVLAFSGGMDSTTLATHYHRTGHRLLLLTADYGQRHMRELEAARAVAAYLNTQRGDDDQAIELRMIDLTSVGALMPGSALTDPSVHVPDGHYAAPSMAATIVPNRNAILANVGIGIAAARGADLFALGIHAGDHAIYPDCRPAFLAHLRVLTETALEGHHTPRIEAPFIEHTKTGIARYADQINAPLHLSWSCYKGRRHHCGACGTCTERREAFSAAGVPDPTRYAEAA